MTDTITATTRRYGSTTFNTTFKCCARSRVPRPGETYLGVLRSLPLAEHRTPYIPVLVLAQPLFFCFIDIAHFSDASWLLCYSFLLRYIQSWAKSLKFTSSARIHPLAYFVNLFTVMLYHSILHFPTRAPTTSAGGIGGEFRAGWLRKTCGGSRFNALGVSLLFWGLCVPSSDSRVVTSQL
jgi:hypothetical protein